MAYDRWNKRLPKGTVLIAWVVVLGWLSIRLSERAVLPMCGFPEYWAAGRLQLTGHNPYSSQQFLALQQSIGWPWDGPLMMWNPPWTLLFVMPFGLLNSGASRVLWLWLSMALLLLCTDRAWPFHGGTIFGHGVFFNRMARRIALDRQPYIIFGKRGSQGIVVEAAGWNTRNTFRSEER